MRRVVLESPYSGDVDQIQRNLRYARACIADCLKRGEAPIASHLLFTQPGILDDTVDEQRKLGMTAGHTWIPYAQACVVYTDLGISDGMQKGIRFAEAFNIPVEMRSIKETAW